MSVTLALGLAAQAAAVLLLRAGLGRGWLGRPFSVFVLVAVAYHSVSEILMLVSDTRRDTRSPRWAVAQTHIDEAVLVVGGALLAAVLGYVAVTRGAGGAPRPDAAPPAAVSELRSLDWRVTGALALPLVAATFSGGGYRRWQPLSLSIEALLPALANAFLVILLVLTAYGFLQRYGVRWVLPVLLVQSAVLVSCGQRLEVLIGAVMLVFLLHRSGHRIGHRSVAAGAAIVVLAALGLMSAREQVGREFFQRDSGFGERALAVAGGATQAPDVGTVRDDVAARLDGNVFAGQLHSSLADGTEPLGPASLALPLLVALPTAVYPGALDDRPLSLTHQLVTQFPVVQRDYAPGLVGSLLGAVGPYGAVGVMLLFGVASALADRWLLRRVTLVRMLLLAGVLQGVLFYEKGLNGMVLSVRSGVLLAALAGVLLFLRRHAAAGTAVGAGARTARTVPGVLRTGVYAEGRS